MGLSSKQVSGSGLDWNQALLESQDLELPKPPNLMRKNHQQQNHQQSSEPLKCPRCDSTNTKFCYYNNYNKSQPRHFCRACKRHWTKGGTLRNVPVGGGRKNKRVKKSTTTTSSTTTATTSTCTNPLTTPIEKIDGGVSSSHMAIHQTPTLSVNDQKDMNSSLYQGLIRPSSSFLLQQNLMSTRGIGNKGFGIGGGNGIFLGSKFPPPLPPQNQSLLFPFSTTSSSFDTNPCSVSTSLQSSNVYNCGEEFRTMEEPTINSKIMPSTSGTNKQPWEIPAAATSGGGGGGGMEMSNYWSWEDLDSLVSTDLNNNPWDDSDVKP